MSSKRRNRGEGTITQLEDGRWRGQISTGVDPATGKRYRPVFYGQTKQEVLKAMRAAQATPTAPGRVTLGDWLGQWFAALSDRVAPSSVVTYTNAVERLKAALGDVRLSSLTATLIERAMVDWQTAGHTKYMRKATLTALRTALKAAVKRKLVAANVASDVPMPKHEPDEIHPMTTDQLRTFITAARADRYYELFLLAADTGMRRGELIALHWSEIDWVASTVRVKYGSRREKGENVLVVPKTKGSRRTVVVSSGTLEALRELRKRVSGDLCFPRKSGGLLAGDLLYRWHFRRTLKRSGLTGFRFHDLRHTCATLLLQAGVNVRVVSERLGHSTATQTLNTYAHVLPGDQARAASIMGDILNRQPTGNKDDVPSTTPPP